MVGASRRRRRCVAYHGRRTGLGTRARRPAMTDHHHDRSEDLLDALRDALRLTDAVPAEVVSAAKESFTWRTIDAELAALSYDSVLTGELAGTRGQLDTRTLSFEFGPLTVEVE